MEGPIRELGELIGRTLAASADVVRETTVSLSMRPVPSGGLRQHGRVLAPSGGSFVSRELVDADIGPRCRDRRRRHGATEGPLSRIPRKTLRDNAYGVDHPVPSTIEDPTVPETLTPMVRPWRSVYIRFHEQAGRCWISAMMLHASGAHTRDCRRDVASLPAHGCRPTRRK